MIQIAHPGDQIPLFCPSTSGAMVRLAPDSATRIFWKRSISGRDRPLDEVKFGARDCDVVKSTPGAADKTHYAEVKTWLDHTIGFPVYVEKTLKGSGR